VIRKAAVRLSDNSIPRPGGSRQSSNPLEGIRREQWALRSLTRRNRQPEWMDEPGLPVDEHKAALAGLARLNWFSRSSAILWPPLLQLVQSHNGSTVRVLDVACGGGDVTVALANRARRDGFHVTFAGCDMSEVALDVASTSARALGLDIEFFQADVLKEDLPTGFDAVTCSLFLHHLTGDDAANLLRRMSQAAHRLLLVHDLIRCRRGYLLAWAASRLLTRSAVVWNDGPSSVEGAFTPSEVLELARRAGLGGAMLSTHWPMRLLLQWRRP
jgi:2-polyprenyl-3-methyl-5-hydroxy-6-metoxy-1,4-benzoquinol methylase